MYFQNSSLGQSRNGKYFLFVQALFGTIFLSLRWTFKETPPELTGKHLTPPTGKHFPIYIFHKKILFYPHININLFTKKFILFHDIPTVLSDKNLPFQMGCLFQIIYDEGKILSIQENFDWVVLHENFPLEGEFFCIQNRKSFPKYEGNAPLREGEILPLVRDRISYLICSLP